MSLTKLSRIVANSCLLLGLTQAAVAADYYASPSGSRYGTGAMSNPWDLTTALSHPSAVRGGDTIWLRGGTYSGSFESRLNGSASAPIYVRQYPGERATIDGAVSQLNTLRIAGANTWYWGFEVTNSSTRNRYTATSDFEYRTKGILISGRGIKLINMIINNVGDAGVGAFIAAQDTELYGNLIYFAGYTDPNRNHGEGLYLQNQTGTKRVIDNMIFANFDAGVHLYGSSNTYLNNMVFEGNTIFSNGIVGGQQAGWGLVLGGGTIATNVTIDQNYFYNPRGYSRSSNIKPSYGQGTSNLRLTNNYSGGPTALGMDAPARNLTATGNTFIGAIKNISGLVMSAVTNTLIANPPAPNRVFVRPNRYDTNKAYVTVFNWSLASTVQADLSSILRSGDTYEIINVQNYFGGPLVRATYTGGQISIPMTSSVVAQPVAPLRVYTSTMPEFGAFEIRKVSGTGGPAPTPTPTPTPTPEPEPEPGTPGSQVLTVEAETGTVTSPMRVSSGFGASGSFVSSMYRDSGTATLTFNTTAAGTYALWASLLAPSSSNAYLYVSVNSGPEVRFDVSSLVSNTTWRWLRYSSLVSGQRSPITLTLPAGANRVRLRMGSPSLLIDRVTLTNNLTQIPQ